MATRTKIPRHVKAQQNREKLLQSAAEVIGELGYLNASISRITERAGLAQGTFYLYFTSQKDLFDQVLPQKGKDVLRFIAERVGESADPLEMERRGLLAFQEYLQINPWFFRLLNEARVVAPKAHALHVANLVRAFVRALLRWKQLGYLQEYEEQEMETLAKIMIASRDYLFMNISDADQEYHELMKASDLETYLKFIQPGINRKHPA